MYIKQCGIECVLPLLKVIEPLFPGYLCARFDLDKHGQAVSYARGVRKIVEFGSGPVELDATMIDAIKERLNNVFITPHSARFKMGQIVHIKGGPLAGLEAVFMREMTARNRVLLFLNTLGLHAELTIGSDQISLPQAL